MMKEFPEYKFMSSQPQLYEYVKEDDPALYEEIKDLVRQGRWEVEGAMWLEADCNLISGESMIRQILLGKQFIKDEFGKDSEILWLPDVFGYSAAMPQILRKSGVTKFFTSKISWNETNQMPYDIFMWQGIDGSEVFSYFLTSQDVDSKDARAFYTGDTRPKQVKGTWERFQQKDIAREAILTFGYGDGGGGPSREMMETGLRLEKGIPGCPSVTFEFAGDFLNRLEKSVRGNRFFPHWVGELYLEYHRGTYTSMARNKKNNRYSEFLMKNAETANVINLTALGREYPADTIRSAWKKVLLCQFHDILPGSSIEEVYRDTDIIYSQIAQSGKKLFGDAMESVKGAVGSDGGIFVFNPNGFTDSSAVEYNGKSYWAENVPAMGWKVVSELSGNADVRVDIEKRVLENKYIRVVFDPNFEIKSIRDKKAGREIVPSGERANMLQAFEDFPRKWDAWEITNYYEEKMWRVDSLDSAEVFEDGIFAGFRVTRHFQDSVIRQIIRISGYDSKIDFVTEADWKNSHILLKTAFPTTIHSDKATYEIQYGNVERPTHRNTSWDQAKFEVCGHKWADISEYGYGVSIINDSKYGYDIYGNTIRLSLIKSATYPNPAADKEVHRFVYSLYPHKGDYREAHTVQKAYALNNPMTASYIAPHSGSLGSEFGFVSADSENMIIEAVKQSESGDGIIVRLYDAYHMSTDTVLRFGIPVSSAEVCDMTENACRSLKVAQNSVRLHVAPFEIVTLKLTFRNSARAAERME
ncbi:MAG: alpha-mannosidase, partial [Eubacteriales bacterium]